MSEIDICLYTTNLSLVLVHIYNNWRFTNSIEFFLSVSNYNTRIELCNLIFIILILIWYISMVYYRISKQPIYIMLKYHLLPIQLLRSYWNIIKMSALVYIWIWLLFFVELQTWKLVRTQEMFFIYMFLTWIISDENMIFNWNRKISFVQWYSMFVCFPCI